MLKRMWVVGLNKEDKDNSFNAIVLTEDTDKIHNTEVITAASQEEFYDELELLTSAVYRDKEIRGFELFRAVAIK